MRILTLVIVCLILSCRPETDPNQVEFRIFNNIPVVQGTINGKPAMFILDTGASLTVLNTQFQERYGYETTRTKVTVQGYGGSREIMAVYNGAVILNGHQLAGQILAQDLRNVSDSFLEHHIEIAGIIGSDFLSGQGSVMDFTTEVLTFH